MIIITYHLLSLSLSFIIFMTTKQKKGALTNNDIIKILGLEDSSIEIINSSMQGDKYIITVQKKHTQNFCPICGYIMHSRGIYTRTINHPILQDGRKIEIKLLQRRYRCTNPICKYTTNDKFNFISPYRRCTNATDLMIVYAFKDPNLTAKQIASMYNVSDTHVLNTFDRYVDMPPRQLTEAICIDEVHININAKYKYALAIQDFITGKPIDILPSRRQETTEPYFASIPPKQRARVKYLVTDMYRHYLGFVDDYFPNAKSVIDSFHVVKLINSRLHSYIMKLIRTYRDRDEARPMELEERLKRHVDFTVSKEYYLLKNYEWLILKNNEDVIYSGKAKYNTKLRRYVTIGEIEAMLFEIDPDLEKLRDLKEKYIRFNRQYGNRYAEAKVKLQYIIDDYESCPYPLFQDIAETLKFHFDAIVNSFIMVEKKCKGDVYVKRLSNSPAEALNRIVKDTKRNGRGYHNFEHLRNRFLFSQRENTAILGKPKTPEEASFKTGKKRGPYKKKR